MNMRTLPESKLSWYVICYRSVIPLGLRKIVIKELIQKFLKNVSKLNVQIVFVQWNVVGQIQRERLGGYDAEEIWDLNLFAKRELKKSAVVVRDNVSSPVEPCFPRFFQGRPCRDKRQKGQCKGKWRDSASIGKICGHAIYYSDVLLLSLWLRWSILTNRYNNPFRKFVLSYFTYLHVNKC